MLHQLWLRPEGLQNQKYVPSGPLQEQFVDLCSRKWQKQDLNQLLLCKALNCFAVPVFCSIPVLDAQQRLEKPFFPVPLNARKFPLPSLKPGGMWKGIWDFWFLHPSSQVLRTWGGCQNPSVLHICQHHSEVWGSGAQVLQERGNSCEGEKQAEWRSAWNEGQWLYMVVP